MPIIGEVEGLPRAKSVVMELLEDAEERVGGVSGVRLVFKPNCKEARAQIFFRSSDLYAEAAVKVYNGRKWEKE